MAFDYQNYYRLEYIGTTGTSDGARINTNYYPTNNTRIVFVATVSDSAWGFGCRSSGSTKEFYTAAFDGDSGKVRFGYNSTNYTSGTNRTAMVGKDVFFDFNKNMFSASWDNNVVSNTFTAGTFTCEYPFYFLSLNSYGSFTNTNPCTIKYGEIYESDVLLHRYYPAERKSDGEIGLYDDITDNFLTNAGVLEFTTGDRVPEGFDSSHYYELEYIETSGTQYINTNYVPFNYANFDVEFDVQAMNNQSGSALYRLNSDYYFSNYRGRLTLGFAGVRIADEYTLSQDRSIYSISRSNGVITYTDSAMSVSKTTNNSSTTSDHIVLFKSENTYGYWRIYRITFTASQTTLVNLIPAKRKSDEMLGLYDTVTGIFFTNAGSGSFTGGKRVSQDFDYDTYYELNYLQSSGTQYIDSGFCDDNGVLYDFKVEFPSLTSNTSIVFGTTSSSYRQYLGFTTSSTILGLGTGSVSPSHSYQSNVPYVCSGSFKKGQISVVVNNESVYSATTSPSYSNSHTLYIFGTYNHNNNTVTNKSTEKLYYLNLYDTNGVLERGLIPAERKSDGVLGYFDTVYGVFYTNIGSGTFISGGRIQYVITTAVSPTGSGSVSGGGTYYKGETAVLVATANSDFEFLKWNDETTNPTKTFAVFDDASYTAYFNALIVITLTYDSRLGSASYVWNGADSITLTATPNRYGSFDSWYIDNVLISTSNPYTYTVTQDTTIEARFSVAYEWIDPITDRTQADITAKNSKAYINYGDLNRIEKDTIYLCYLLHEEYPALDNLTVKTNWVRTDIPSVNNMERIRSNAETILRTLYPTDSIQTFGNQFNYENANDIESALLTIYEEVNNA